MALFSRIYFNAVFGALGGLLGWLLFGAMGEKNPSQDYIFLFFTPSDFIQVLAGVIIGGIIGFFIVGVEAIRDKAIVKFARLASYGLLLGVLGGGPGMFLGDKVNSILTGVLGGNILVVMIARALGWSLLGVAIGMSEGIAARSMRKLYYGTFGGALGGLLGGAMFGFFLYISKLNQSATYLWAALGLMILGACIGMLSAFVQAVFLPANVRVMRGWQEGREYPLDKPSNLLGREEHADIAIFRDMKVEKKHAFIKQVNGKYILVNNGAPPENTLVNEQPVAQSKELQDGDRIQLGNVILKFQLRAAQNRAKVKRPLPTAGATAS